MNKNEQKRIKKQIKDFLNDPAQKKIEIKVPKDFRMWHVANPLMIAYRWFIYGIHTMIPPSHIKDWIISSTGPHIGYDVFIAPYTKFDLYFSQLTTIRIGSLVGGMAEFRNHELKDGKLTIGRIDIKDKALIGGYATVLPGSTVNSYSILATRCEVAKDVPPRSFVIGKDIIKKTFNDEEVEKYFGDSNFDPNYYRMQRKKTREFRRNKNLMLISYRNNGKRLNPANEWYKARFFPVIYWNTLWVQVAQIMPSSGLRKFIYRLMGIHFGKNVHIGRNVIIDYIYGDKVTFGNNMSVADADKNFKTYIDGHSYTIAETIYGRVKIGDNTKLGKNIHVACGTTIGKNCTVLDNSSVMKDIPDGETWGGVPAKKVEK